MRNGYSFLYITLILILSVSSIQAQQIAEDDRDDGNGFYLKLRNADIETLISTVAKRTGKNFIVDPRVKGKINVIASTAMDEEELYGVFLSVLQLYGFAVIEAGGVTKIVPDVRAKQGPVPTEVETNQQALDQLVTRVLRLKHAAPDKLAPILRPLIPQEAHFAAVPGGPFLIISDRSGNIGRLADIIDTIDQPSGKEFTIIRLRYAVAGEVAEILKPMVTTEDNAERASLKILTEVRTNSLIVVAEQRSEIERVNDIVARIDTPVDAEIEIIPLEHASAVEVVRIVESVFGVNGSADGAQSETAPIIVADERTNRVILSGPQVIRFRIRGLIVGLDTELVEDLGDTQVIYLKYAKAENLAPVLQRVIVTEAHTITDVSSEDTTPTAGVAANRSAIGNVLIEPELEINALIVTAPPEEMSKIQALVRKIDIRRAQVLVEAIIVEVSEDKSKNIGTQFLLERANRSAAAGIFGGKGNNIIGLSGDPLSAGSGLTFGLGESDGQGTDFLILLRALLADSSTNILSTPSIVAMDNETAEIVIGQNVPFVTGQFTSAGSANNSNDPFQTIERQDVGITLKVTPQINDGDIIRMDIQQEVSSLSRSSSEASDLITNKRSIKTSILVKDNQLLVLGGLVDDQLRDSEEKIPLLGDIPIVGGLFRNRSSTKVKQNLMVFMRPIILRDRVIEDFLTSEKYNYLRSKQLEAEKKQISVLPEGFPMLPKLELISSTKD